MLMRQNRNNKWKFLLTKLEKIHLYEMMCFDSVIADTIYTV